METEVDYGSLIVRYKGFVKNRRYSELSKKLMKERLTVGNLYIVHFIVTDYDGVPNNNYYSFYGDGLNYCFPYESFEVHDRCIYYAERFGLK